MSVHGIHSNNPLPWDSPQVRKPKPEPETSPRVTNIGTSTDGKEKRRSGDDRQDERPDTTDPNSSDNHGPDTGTIINVTG